MTEPHPPVPLQACALRLAPLGPARELLTLHAFICMIVYVEVFLAVSLLLLFQFLLFPPEGALGDLPVEGADQPNGLLREVELDLRAMIRPSHRMQHQARDVIVSQGIRGWGWALGERLCTKGCQQRGSLYHKRLTFVKCSAEPHVVLILLVIIINKMSKNKSAGAPQFLNFVNSIITDRVKLNAPKQQQVQPSTVKPQSEEQGDLALMAAINSGVKPSSKDKKEAASANRGALGLGYSASQAELEANTQIQRLKNQIRKTQEQEELQRQKDLGLSKTLHSDGAKHSHISKKQLTQGDDKAAMISAKQEKKRQKKERQKEKKKNEQTSSKHEVTPSNQAKENEEKEYESEVQKKKAKYRLIKEGQEGERYRKRTKTRSKQKNRRRDNRPEDVKRAKLAEKGISF